MCGIFQGQKRLDAFCIDEEQNKIIVASNEKITIFNLSPTPKEHTEMIPNLKTGSLHSLCLKQDRFAAVSGNWVVCFSLSGQQLFQCQIPNVESIRCVTFDPLKNVYVCSTKYKNCCPCGYKTNPHARFCAECGSTCFVTNDCREVYQILSDGSYARLFISEGFQASFLFFSEYSELFILSDGTKFTNYKLNT